MYDGNRACWTDFCDLIFREGNEKFRTCMCIRIEWDTLIVGISCFGKIMRNFVRDGYWLSRGQVFPQDLLEIKVKHSRKTRIIFHLSSVPFQKTSKQTKPRILYIRILDRVALKLTIL